MPTTMTEEPMDMMPLIPPSLTFAPGNRIVSTAAFAVTVPGRLRSPLPSSDSDSCSRWPSRVDGCIRCNGTWPPPAPGGRLALMVEFAVTVPGRLGLGQPRHVQAKVVEV